MFLININSIKDEEYVANVRKELVPMIEEGTKLCDKLYDDVAKNLDS